MSKIKNIFSRKIIIILLILILVLLNTIVFFFFMSPTLELNGQSEITIKVNEEYIDEGVNATYLGKNIDNDVEVNNDVDTSKIGEYEITYKIKKGLIERVVTRKVYVKDLDKPVLELKGEKSVYVCQGKQYVEEGYVATDNIDGDITDKVVSEVLENEIRYSVKDSSGNESSIERKIEYKDTDKPTITLTGGNYSIYQNSTYREKGYKATDNCDGNITKNVKVSGNVDTSKLGTYELTYSVKDSSGNTASVIRKVSVIKLVKGGTIYLTFDDGPREGTTNVILDILKEENVKATFFVTNGGPDYLIKRIVDEGHTIALHTATHNYKTVYSSVDAYFNDLAIVHDRVKRLTGVDSKIIRFPGGSSNTVSKNYSKGIMTILAKEVVNRGYKYYDWNIESGDAGKTTTSSGVYNNVIKYLSKTRINMVLMHDVKTYTRDALRNIIIYGKENGYSFAAITADTPVVHHGISN